MASDSVYAVIQNFGVKAQHEASKALRTLVEGKHLYQSVSLELGAIPYVNDDRRDVVPLVESVRNLVNGAWTVVNPQDQQLRVAATHQAHKFFYLVPPDAKLYCETCDRVEAFNPVSAADCFDPMHSGVAYVHPS